MKNSDHQPLWHLKDVEDEGEPCDGVHGHHPGQDDGHEGAAIKMSLRSISSN